MLAESLTRPIESGGTLHRRSVALANARWFRALAWRALRDGAPKADLRAANARAAARIVLQQAKRERVQDPSDRRWLRVARDETLSSKSTDPTPEQSAGWSHPRI